MKHLRFTLLLLMVCGSSILSFAAPGDTTIVTTSPVLNADASTNYDTMIVLPTTTTYRKIFLIYTVNSHTCAASATYCHQWDYLGNVVLKSPHGDTVELARIITPFATSGSSRFPAPPAWSEDYVFDVTDFAPLLRDTVTINSALGVGSPGFGIYTKLVFIEGTPDRNTIAIHPLYSHGAAFGGGTYGSATTPINTHFPVLNETAPAGTVSAAFRLIVTGHGSDANYCCEFAEHYYDLILNGTPIQRQYVWRTCGMNELYPQGGTWLYDRSNWCPGSSVLPYYHALPGVTAGTSYNINIAFEPYTVASASGNYHTGASAIYYGGMNKTLDASIEDIIAPSSSPQHFRENPANNLPTVHIHNSGGTAISSVAFQYGVVDSTMQTYLWNGTLPSLADTVISLPASTSLAYMSSTSQSGTFPFIITITGVNGTPDADQTNDTMRSKFIVAPRWPDTLVVKMLTSNLGADGANINVNPADASWYITNVNGDTIVSRTNTNYSTLYLDTVTLPANGYYKFFISSPAFCSGLHYWAFDQGFTGYAPGYLHIKKLTGAFLTMHGYTYATSTTPTGLKNGGEHDDFGCGYSQYFYVSTASNVGIHGVKNTSSIVIYPNPANEEINVEFNNIDTHGSSISVVNILGQKVYSAALSSGSINISSRDFAPGLYTILYSSADGNSNNVGKVMIAH
jgi:hypothetical protein